MQDLPIIQLTYSDGMTTWEKRGSYIAGTRDRGRYAWVWDLQNLLHTTYDAERGCIMICNMETPDFMKEGTPISTLDSIVEGLKTRGERLEEVWDVSEITSAGRLLIELRNKQSTKGYPGTKIILIDPVSRKVVSWTNWGPQTGWADVRIDVSYPQTAPSSIYELGVPADTRVIDGRASPELLALRAQVLAARERGFGPYHMVLISTGAAKSITRVISDGKRHRVDFIPLAQPGNHTREELAGLTQTYIRTDPSDNRYVYAVFDGNQETQLYRDDHGMPSSRALTRPGYFSRFMHLLDYHAWQRSQDSGFLMNARDHLDDLIGPDEHGCLGHRTRLQAEGISRPSIEEWWYDPAHGYRLSARRRFSFPQAEWQMKPNWQDEYIRWDADKTHYARRPLPDAPAAGWEIAVVEWGLLRDGEWYPALLRQRSLIQNANGGWEERSDAAANDEPYIMAGEIIYDKKWTNTPVTYTRILAEPLDHVEDAWFELPEEWLSVPAQPWPH
jgi:hypothetical protein